MNLILRFLFLVLVTTNVFAQCESGKNHIFLLHGIGGGKGTFGSLEGVLNLANKCFAARTFVYKTGSNQTPTEFALDFDQFVTILRNNGSIGPQDKISLVMHSQGGLVGSLWLKLLVLNKSDLLPKIDAFITLSTPYWGADAASIGRTIFYTLPDGFNNPISPFGRNELNEMSFGSYQIQDFTRNLDSVLNEVPKVRVLTMAGIKKIYNSIIGEDDVVVPLYSMNPSRFQIKDTVNLFETPNLVRAFQFTKTKEYPFHVVSADHLTLGQRGIASVQRECVRNIKCAHPSLGAILDHLQEKKVEERKVKLSTFRVTMYLNNPFSQQFDPNDITIAVNGGQGVNIPVIERITPRGNSHLKKGQAFTFRGTLNKDEASVTVILKYRNKNVRTYEVPVKQGLSSFIDTDVSPM